MHVLKKLAVLAVAVCALSVVGVASASAAQFTASETGTLTGEQEGNQVFTAASGSPAVVCAKAHTEGEITSTAATTQEVTVVYSSCSIPELFGASVDNITATYNLHADGTVDILKPIVIRATSLGCSTTVGEQTASSASYKDVNGETEVTQSSAITGISSTSTGLCPSGTTGTYSGNNIVHRVGGGWLRFDP